MAKTMFGRFLLFSLLILSACGSPKSSHRAYGKMSVADLIQEKGQPLKEESIPVKDGKVLHFKEDERFQIQGTTVINSFRNPKSDEMTVLFWKNKFRGCDSETKILKPAGAQSAERELSCKEQGLSVIYTDRSEVISRVVEYAIQ
jgi:hypothetical protein